jgi:hypothetical protein
MRSKFEQDKMNVNAKQSLKLINEAFRMLFEEEKEDSKYSHVGGGAYKEKGKEKDPNSPTFKKDDGKFVKADTSSGGKEPEPQAGVAIKGADMFKHAPDVKKRQAEPPRNEKPPVKLPPAVAPKSAAPTDGKPALKVPPTITPKSAKPALNLPPGVKPKTAVPTSGKPPVKLPPVVAPKDATPPTSGKPPVKTPTPATSKGAGWDEPDWMKNAPKGWDDEKVKKGGSSWGDEPTKEPDWMKGSDPTWGGKANVGKSGWGDEPTKEPDWMKGPKGWDDEKVKKGGSSWGDGSQTAEPDWIKNAPKGWDDSKAKTGGWDNYEEPDYVKDKPSRKESSSKKSTSLLQILKNSINNGK